MLTTRFSAGLGAVLIAVQVGGCSSAGVKASNGKTSPKEPVAVKAVVAEQSLLRRTTTQPATVYAFYSADIYSKVGGYVLETEVDIGDKVKKGDVLAIIDVPEIEKQLLVTEARVARAKAQHARTEAERSLTRAKLSSANAGIAAAESQVSAAVAQLGAAEAEFTRTESMVEQQAVQPRLLDESRQRRDKARADVESANASVTMAQSQVTVAKVSIEAANADVKAAQAETEVAQAECAELQVILDYAELRAPFDGVITHRGIDPGDLVRNASDTRGSVDPHFIVTQTDRVRVRTTVPEIEAPLVDIGDAVTINLTSANLPVIEGQVTRTSGSLDPSTRTMAIEIDLPNEDGKLLPGMYGEAMVTLIEKPDAVTLPASAVRFNETGQSFVYAIDDAGKVELVEVTLGYDTGGRLEIASLLPAGQLVIDAHLKRFSKGDIVRVVQ